MISKEVYLPSRNVAVDEILLLFKGRLYFRSYIPSKRSRYGIKIYALVDEYAYTWNFVVNTSQADMDLASDIDGCQNFLFSEKVVLHLAEPLFDMNFSVFIDNFFTSVRLAEFLQSRRTSLCETVRFNRCPNEIRDNYPVVNEIKFFRYVLQLIKTCHGINYITLFLHCFYRKGAVHMSCFTEKSHLD